MKLYFKYFSIQLRSAMQYKTSFLLNTISQGILAITSAFAVYFLFDRFGNIKGYTLDEIFLCFSTIFISFSLGECFARGFDRFSTIISNGEFDRIMLRPRNEILQVLGSKIEFTRVGKLIQAVFIFIYAISISNIEWSYAKVLTLLLMIIGGTCLFISIFMIYAAICFFTIEGLEFMNIFTNGSQEIAEYPLNIYKDWVIKFFTYVIPLAFVNYYPFLFLIDRVYENKILYIISPMVSMLFLIPAYILWKIGVKHYKSIGA